MKLTINGTEYEVMEVHAGGYLPMIETEAGEEFYVAENSEEAGKAARQYWEELAQHDRKEFACLIGEDTLVCWALGESAGPGSTKVKSLEEWLDLWLDIPAEEFASYDGDEREAENADDELTEELGFTPTVAYRHN